MKGIAIFQGRLLGYVSFIQKEDGVNIYGEVHGINTCGLHGFHIHTYGDLRLDCDKCQGHWNPTNKLHGGKNDIDSHAGDLGNIRVNNQGIANIRMQTDKFKVKDIIGRSIIIHSGEDDLGTGNNKMSKITGNSGSRLDCAVIGIAK